MKNEKMVKAYSFYSVKDITVLNSQCLRDEKSKKSIFFPWHSRYKANNRTTM